MIFSVKRITTVLIKLKWRLSVFVLVHPAFAQTDTIGYEIKKQSVKEFGATFHYGSIFAHSEAVQNTAGSNPVGVELSYTWQRRDKGVVDLCNCFPRQGIVLSYFNFDTEILGRGYMAGWMLEPTYRLGNKLQLGIKGIAGLTYMTNPFDSVKNPTNQSYSTAISAYLLVGLNLSYPIGEKWRLQAGGNFGHTSNGGMRQPNKGVNFPTGSIGILYAPNPVDFYKGTRDNEKTWKGKPWRKDLQLFGTGKRSANQDGVGTRQPIAGLTVLGSKQVARTNALTVGMEGYYDGFNANRMEADTILNTSPMRIGLMGGHEFLLGRFIFSQQLGVYLYKPAPYDKSWFHRWGLLYGVNKHFWAGINLKAHVHVADFIDFRVAYSL
jgi:hypothetical protein